MDDFVNTIWAGEVALGRVWYHKAFCARDLLRPCGVQCFDTAEKAEAWVMQRAKEALVELENNLK